MSRTILSIVTGPSDRFVRLSRNPDAVEVRHRESAAEIARRLRERVPPVPAVMRDVG